MQDVTIFIDHAELLQYIYSRNYKKIKEYIETHLEKTLQAQNNQMAAASSVEMGHYKATSILSGQYASFRKIFNSPNPVEKNQTLFEFLCNNFQEFSDKQTLKDNVDLINFLIDNELITQPGSIHWTRPDGGATLIPSFYKKFNSTHFFTVAPKTYKEATDILSSGIKPPYLYAACLLNLVRCLQQLQTYKTNHPNLPENKSKLINDIITTIDQNFENFVSFNPELRMQAGKNIDAVVNDENIKILSYQNDSALLRIIHDVIKVLLIYPLLSRIFSSQNFQSSNEPFFHYFGCQNSFMSNIVNEMSLTLATLAAAKEGCSILKEEFSAMEEENNLVENNLVSSTL